MTASPPAPDIVIEPERPQDRAAVREVVRLAFAPDDRVAELVDLVRESPEYVPGLSLVARDPGPEGEVVGHVMLSYAHVVAEASTTRHRVLSLSPLAVAPSRQRQGIGSALVLAGLREAEAMGEPLVMLEGSPAYYPRFGFRDSRDLGITIDLPSWAPPDAGMVHPLTAYDPAIRGRLEYPPAFDGVIGD